MKGQVATSTHVTEARSGTSTNEHQPHKYGTNLDSKLAIYNSNYAVEGKKPAFKELTFMFMTSKAIPNNM